MTLQEERLLVANQVFQNYVFPGTILETGSWEGVNERTLQRVVFLEVDPQLAPVDYIFWVIFHSGSSVVHSSDLVRKM